MLGPWPAWGQPVAGGQLPNIRPGDELLGQLLSDGYVRSGTLRELIDRLEAAPVVVFIRAGSCPARVHACLHLLAAEPGSRTLRITVERSTTGGAHLVGLLAHELQHALEITREESIRDVASFAAFYQAHGRRNSAGFETEQARRIARKVERELNGHR